jgi:hypothetical protein
VLSSVEDVKVVYVAAPEIASISNATEGIENSGYPGDTIVIGGTGFNSVVEAGNEIRLGETGDWWTVETVDSDEQIQLAAGYTGPTGSDLAYVKDGAGEAQLLTGLVTFETDMTTVTGVGTHFQTPSTVEFGSGRVVGGADMTSCYFDAITVKAPDVRGSVTMIVTNPDGRKDVVYGGFTFIDPLSISEVTPSDGYAGDLVTIVGSGFVRELDTYVYGALSDTWVEFGGIKSPNVAWVHSGKIIAEAPVGTGDVKVTVQNDATHSVTYPGAGGAFVYNPRITDVKDGVDGDDKVLEQQEGRDIKITGSNFQAGVVVKIGGVVASEISRTGIEIHVQFPAGVTGGLKTVQVINPDGGHDEFNYLDVIWAPNVQSLEWYTWAEVEAQGDYKTKIVGAHFQENATVQFGSDNYSPSVTWNSEDELEVVVPAGSGTVDVIVTNPDGQYDTLSGAFTY